MKLVENDQVINTKKLKSKLRNLKNLPKALPNPKPKPLPKIPNDIRYIPKDLQKMFKIEQTAFKFTLINYGALNVPYYNPNDYWTMDTFTKFVKFTKFS